MTSIADTFNRADSSASLGTASDGGTWTIRGNGTFGISSNQAYEVAVGGAPLLNGTSFATRDAGGPVQDVTVDSIRSNTTGAGFLLVGYDPATGNGYLFTYDASTGTHELDRVTSNSAGVTLSTTVSPAWSSWSAGTSTLRVTYDGAGALKVYQGGTLKMSVTDSTIYTGTWVGLASNASSGVDKWDNFTATGSAAAARSIPRRPVVASRAVSRAAVI